MYTNTGYRSWVVVNQKLNPSMVTSFMYPSSSYMIDGNWEVAELSGNLKRWINMFAMGGAMARMSSTATTTDHQDKCRKVGFDSLAAYRSIMRVFLSFYTSKWSKFEEGAPAPPVNWSL